MAKFLDELVQSIGRIFQILSDIAADVRKWAVAMVLAMAGLVCVHWLLPLYRTSVAIPLDSGNPSALYFLHSKFEVLAPDDGDSSCSSIEIDISPGLQVDCSCESTSKQKNLDIATSDHAYIDMPGGCRADLSGMEVEPGCPIVELRFSGNNPTLRHSLRGEQRAPIVQVSKMVLSLTDGDSELLILKRRRAGDPSTKAYTEDEVAGIQRENGELLERYVEKSDEPLACFLRNRLLFSGGSGIAGIRHELNWMVRRRDLLSTKMFKDTPLRRATRELADRNPGGVELTLLNCMLLEDALPSLLEPALRSSRFFAIRLKGSFTMSLAEAARRPVIRTNDGQQRELDPAACSALRVVGRMRGECSWSGGDRQCNRMTLSAMGDNGLRLYGAAPTILDARAPDVNIPWRDLLFYVSLVTAIVMLVLRFTSRPRSSAAYDLGDW